MSFAGTPPFVRRVLLCQHIAYDANNPLAPYSLHGLVTHLVPEAGDSFPLMLPQLYLFFQAFGDTGDHQIWIDLVPVDEDGNPVGQEVTYGPCVLVINEGAYLESRGWRLPNLPFAGLALVRVGPDRPRTTPRKGGLTCPMSLSTVARSPRRNDLKCWKAMRLLT